MKEHVIAWIGTGTLTGDKYNGRAATVEATDEKENYLLRFDDGWEEWYPKSMTEPVGDKDPCQFCGTYDVVIDDYGLIICKKCLDERPDIKKRLFDSALKENQMFGY